MDADDHEAADAAVTSLTAGARIAGYQLEERIGTGGMAVVFRARAAIRPGEATIRSG